MALPARNLSAPFILTSIRPSLLRRRRLCDGFMQTKPNNVTVVQRGGK